MICDWKLCTNEVPKNPYRGHELKYCSKQCKNKAMVDRLRTKRKQLAVDYLGGKCSNCGYDRSLAALHFHHKNPSQKEFQINRSITMAWEKIVAELEKCILLCANCHAEEHHLVL